MNIYIYIRIHEYVCIYGFIDCMNGHLLGQSAENELIQIFKFINRCVLFVCVSIRSSLNVYVEYLFMYNMIINFICVWMLVFLDRTSIRYIY